MIIQIPNEGKPEGYLDNQCLDARKASEETGKHLDLIVDFELQVQGQHLDA
jgi:hypothetical protein